MILDGQNYFSDLANGDKPRTQADDASAYVIDQQGKNSIFSEGGGAEKALWLKAIVQTAFTSGSSTATVAPVVQDSADNVTYADVLVGPATLVTSLTAGVDLWSNPTRLPSKLRRYIRLVYRVGVEAVTAGTVVAFLTPDQDIHDLSQRQSTGTVSEPTGALDESTSGGVLAS